MGAVGVVVHKAFAEDGLEVPAAENEHPVQALPADRPDEALEDRPDNPLTRLHGTALYCRFCSGAGEAPPAPDARDRSAAFYRAGESPWVSWRLH
jgi:hypothetical protein